MFNVGPVCVLPPFLVRFAHKEYVASLIGLYKNNGAVLCVGNNFPFISYGVTFNLIPNCMKFNYGQISIETATYSLHRTLSKTFN